MSDPEEPLLNLRNPAVRARLAGGLPAVIWMLDSWGLTRAQQAELLTLRPTTLRQVQRAVVLPALNMDQVMRLSFLTGIYRAVYALYEADTAAGWMRRANGRAPFLGQTPLGYLLAGGIPALLATRRLLESDLGGQFTGTPSTQALARSLPQPDIQLDD
ncbi:DUF2384 domain-containing protein [Deinococcus sp. Arct2-2]|uniref:DUF2384 domain-containing protein n=1 Tax=Deinococcus sp. Arct2-2 TaxID=2568653 RepID=UPI0010A42161|nr:DUF2384 domain-containing protein [Deinococcus sp. Arct2-2]THF70960.1 DUF2384 domain-containing protein [Deinococcus sp. Arct2-2]